MPSLVPVEWQWQSKLFLRRTDALDVQRPQYWQTQTIIRMATAE